MPLIWRTLLLLLLLHVCHSVAPPVAAPARAAPLGHEPVPRLREHLEHLLLLAVHAVPAVATVGVIVAVLLLLLLLLLHVLLVTLSCILNHSRKKLWFVVRIAARMFMKQETIDHVLDACFEVKEHCAR